jgi:hypothetical protein
VGLAHSPANYSVPWSLFLAFGTRIHLIGGNVSINATLLISINHINSFDLGIQLIILSFQTLLSACVRIKRLV